jgi:membrane-bound inhibitor of C-type lysozyme
MTSLIAACSTTYKVGTQAPPAGKVAEASYLCADGTMIHARYYIDAQSVDLTVGDSAEPVRLPVAMSGSGARYSDGAYELWEHQGKARVTLPSGTVHDECATQQ